MIRFWKCMEDDNQRNSVRAGSSVNNWNYIYIFIWLKRFSCRHNSIHWIVHAFGDIDVIVASHIAFFLLHFFKSNLSNINSVIRTRVFHAYWELYLISFSMFVPVRIGQTEQHCSHPSVYLRLPRFSEILHYCPHHIGCIWFAYVKLCRHLRVCTLHQFMK